MEKYIGTKIILAESMEAHVFVLREKRDIKSGADVNTDGHSQNGYMVKYEDGYVSWSPKETFERAYRRITDAELEMVK